MEQQFTLKSATMEAAIKAVEAEAATAKILVKELTLNLEEAELKVSEKDTSAG